MSKCWEDKDRNLLPFLFFKLDSPTFLKIVSCVLIIVVSPKFFNKLFPLLFFSFYSFLLHAKIIVIITGMSN